MKIKFKDTEVWHKWYAWHPVFVNNTLVWFEYVERKENPNPWGSNYSYRECE